MLVDNETVQAVRESFITKGKAAAIAELRQRFWLLDNAVEDVLVRVLAYRHEKTSAMSAS